MEIFATVWLLFHIPSKDNKNLSPKVLFVLPITLGKISPELKNSSPSWLLDSEIFTPVEVVSNFLELSKNSSTDPSFINFAIYSPAA